MGDLTNDSNFQEMMSEKVEGKNDDNKMTSNIFTELMKTFYDLGWMRGSGGAMGCISGDNLLISPSALQKDRLEQNDLFVYNLKDKKLVSRPQDAKITVSSCGVLFTLIMNQTGSSCVIHTHSKAANLLTQLIKEDTFEISHQEYIKGIYNPFSGKMLQNEDTLVIPIIENKPSESLLLEPIAEKLQEYPQAIAVLVRNHGLFVWGQSWESAKIMTECIDYLLELAIDMLKHKLPLVKEDNRAVDKESRIDYLETVFSP